MVEHLIDGFVVPARREGTVGEMRDFVDSFNSGLRAKWCLYAFRCPRGGCERCIYSEEGGHTGHKIRAFAKYARSLGFNVTRDWSENLSGTLIVVSD